MHESVNGLLRDRSRPPGKAPIPPERVAEIVQPDSASAGRTECDPQNPVIWKADPGAYQRASQHIDEVREFVNASHIAFAAIDACHAYRSREEYEDHNERQILYGGPMSRSLTNRVY